MISRATHLHLFDCALMASIIIVIYYTIAYTSAHTAIGEINENTLKLISRLNYERKPHSVFIKVQEIKCINCGALQ